MSSIFFNFFLKKSRQNQFIHNILELFHFFDRKDTDVKEFYLGLIEPGKKKSCCDVRHRKRRQRWLTQSALVIAAFSREAGGSSQRTEDRERKTEDREQHSPLSICLLSSVIRHLISVICHPYSVTRHLSSVFCHPSSAIRLLTSVIRLLSSVFCLTV